MKSYLIRRLSLKYYRDITDTDTGLVFLTKYDAENGKCWTFLQSKLRKGAWREVGELGRMMDLLKKDVESGKAIEITEAEAFIAVL